MSGPRERVLLKSPAPGLLSDRRFERLVLLLGALAAFVPYLVINRVTADWPAHDLSTPLDRALPLLPAWESVYWAIYPLALLPAFYLKDAQLFRRSVAAFFLMQLISYPVFLVLPVGIERPEELLDVNRGFWEWGLALNYTLDAPRNLFPSLHVGNSFLTALEVRRADRGAGGSLLLLATGIAVSTLLVKQHHLADVVAGIALAISVYAIVFGPLRLEGRSRRELCYPRWALGAAAAVYGAVVLGMYLAWRAGWRPFG
jgi:membrane-associated phospholipid phosphatase